MRIIDADKIKYYHILGQWRVTKDDIDRMPDVKEDIISKLKQAEPFNNAPVPDWAWKIIRDGKT